VIGVFELPLEFTTMSQRFACLWFAALMLVGAGCSDKTPNYTPSVADAESALKQGLDAWKAGLPSGEVAGTTPLVFVTDNGRKPDQVLADYRILGEAKGPSGRTFVVVLNLQNPDEELKTQYIVVGIDPLWVFRQEDYELLTHWDHLMPPEEKTNKSEPPTKLAPK
jgi:hypothetical protein